MNIKAFNASLTKLKTFCKTHNIDIQLRSNTFEFDYDSYCIKCDYKLYNKPQYICGLLHEIGHAIQNVSPFNDLKLNKTALIALMVEQEFSAWEIGKMLALNLHIYDDIESIYESEWARNWYTYIKHLPGCSVKELKTLRSGYTFK